MQHVMLTKMFDRGEDFPKPDITFGHAVFCIYIFLHVSCNQYIVSLQISTCIK